MNSPRLIVLFASAILLMCLGALIALGGVWVWGQISSPSAPAQAKATALSPTTSSPQSPKVSSSPTRIWNAVGNNPVIGKNFVFVTTSKGNAAALDLNSGQQKWETEFQVNSLFETEGILAVLRPDARIYSLDESSGEVKWKYLIPDGYHVEWASAERDTLAFYATAGFNFRMIGLDLGTGQVKWERSGETHQSEFIAPMGDKYSLWSCTYSCKAFYFVDLTTGATKSFTPSSVTWDIQSVVSLPNSLIARVSGYNRLGEIVALDPTNLNEKWRTKEGDGSAMIQNTVYRLEQRYSGSPEGTGTAFDADSGKEKWTWDMGTIGRPIGGFSDVVYFQSHRGIFYAVNAQTGTTLWQNDEIVASSVITQTQDTVYISTVNATVGLDAKTGKRKWKYDTEPVASTAIGGRILYWSNTRLLFLDDTGKQTWSQNISGIAQIIPLSNGFLTVGNNGISLFR